MVRGYLLKYKSINNNSSRTLLNYTLYGRLVHRKYKGMKFVNYIPGMLHSVEYYKIKGGEIFIKDINTLNFDLLNIFGNFEYNEIDIPPQELVMITGEKFWIGRAMKNGLTLKKSRKRKW